MSDENSEKVCADSSRPASVSDNAAFISVNNSILFLRKQNKLGSVIFMYLYSLNVLNDGRICLL